MPEIRTSYNSLDDVPESVEDFRDLFTEKDGKVVLTGIAGLKTQEDVDRINEGLRKEKNDHKATKAKLSAWSEIGEDPEKVAESLARIPELETAAKGKLDDADIDKIANERAERIAKSRISPLERDVKALTTERDELLEQRDTLAGEKKRRTIHDLTRKALMDSKALPEAHDDALFQAERLFEIREDDGAVVTRDGVGVTPGIDPATWLAEIQDKKPHWWPGSVGGNAKGSGGGGGFSGKNPWSADGWNMTEQGRIVREKGKDTADKMAKAAGTTVGGPKPAPRAAQGG